MMVLLSARRPLVLLSARRPLVLLPARRPLVLLSARRPLMVPSWSLELVVSVVADEHFVAVVPLCGLHVPPWVLGHLDLLVEMAEGEDVAPLAQGFAPNMPWPCSRLLFSGIRTLLR